MAAKSLLDSDIHDITSPHESLDSGLRAVSAVNPVTAPDAFISPVNLPTTTNIISAEQDVGPTTPVPCANPNLPVPPLIPGFPILPPVVVPVPVSPGKAWISSARGIWTIILIIIGIVGLVFICLSKYLTVGAKVAVFLLTLLLLILILYAINLRAPTKIFIFKGRNTKSVETKKNPSPLVVPVEEEASE